MEVPGGWSGVWNAWEARETRGARTGRPPKQNAPERSLLASPLPALAEA